MGESCHIECGMITIGIYGRIGSGKSEVAKVFAEKGAAVISADKIGKYVVDNNRSVLNALIDAFGSEIVDSDGNLKRRELGKIVFSSPEKRAKLDSIVHPALLRELRLRIDDFKSSGSHHIVVIDAALILNWGLENELDILICVTAPEKLQIERMIHSGLSRDEAKDRLQSQIPTEIQISKADFVINNDGSLDDLRNKAEKLFEQISGSQKIN